MLQAWMQQAKRVLVGKGKKVKRGFMMILGNEFLTKMENSVFTKKCSVFALQSLKIWGSLVKKSKRLRSSLSLGGTEGGGEVLSGMGWKSLSLQVPERRWVSRGYEVNRTRAALPERCLSMLHKRLPGSFYGQGPLWPLGAWVLLPGGKHPPKSKVPC